MNDLPEVEWLFVERGYDADWVRDTLMDKGTKPSIPGRKKTAVLHRSTAIRNAPYPRRNSGGAFEMRAAKSGHSVENADANLSLCFLIFEASRL